MKETPQQLQEMLRQFYGPDESRQIAEDIAQAEARMASVPSPRMRPEALSRIQGRVAACRGRSYARLWQTAVAAAACLAIVSTLFVINRPSPDVIAPQPPVAMAVQSWEAELLADFEEADVIASELDDISNQLQDLQASQWDEPAPWQQDLFELENSDLITSTSFWKG